MIDFFQACQAGLEANKRLAHSESELQFQNTLEQQYNSLKAEVEPLLLVQQNTMKNNKKKKGGVRFE